MMDIQYLGNQELLKLQKTAFLASNTIPIEMVLKCYDWATGKHDGCVISGFSSKTMTESQCVKDEEGHPSSRRVTTKT